MVVLAIAIGRFRKRGGMFIVSKEPRGNLLLLGEIFTALDEENIIMDMDIFTYSWMDFASAIEFSSFQPRQY